MVHLQDMSDPIILSDRAVLAISGEDRHSFLNTLLSADVAEVEGAARFAALLSPQGKLLADILCLTEADRVLIDYPTHSDFAKRLRMYKLRAAVTLDLLDDWSVGVSLDSRTAADDPQAAFADPRAKTLGHRIFAPALVGSRDRTAYDRARIAAVVPEGPTDLEPNKALLLENAFERLGGVDFRKGCFVGQEVTARMKYRNLGKKRLMAIRCDGALETGEAIMAGERTAGTVLTATNGEALALIRHEFADKPLTISGQNAHITADPDADAKPLA